MVNSYEFECVFHDCDLNGDGKVSSSELRHCVASVSGELSLEEVETIVRCLDSDGDGQLRIGDFVGLVDLEGGEKVKELKEAFGMYVTDGCDCITPASLKRMLSRLGEMKTVDECRVMIDHFDLNGDGILSFDEFMAMMQ